MTAVSFEHTRNAYQLHLERHGFSVIGASSVSESLRLLGTGSFDLVIIDAFLAGDSGLELLKGVVAARQDLPVIMMSGIEHDPSLLQEARDAGAMGVYNKVSPSSQLLIEVQRILRPPNQPRA